MATITCVPTQPRVGQPVVITGSDFIAATKTTLQVQLGTDGIDVLDILSDASGQVCTSDTPDAAVATLTSSGVNVTANDTVTIDGVVYTFKAAPTTVANEVLIGASAAATLANLKAAINLSGTSGTTYGSATVIHPTVTAGALTATTLLLYAKTGGTGGNSLGFAKSAVTLTVSGANFSGGAAATGRNALVYTPSKPGVLKVTGSDGTNTATLNAQVFT